MSLRTPSLKNALPIMLCTLAVVFNAFDSIAAESASLDKIMAGDHRSDVNRARDVYRHPVETLAFFGVKPESTVVEIFPGGGWYTELLAPYLRDNGRYVAVIGAQATRGLKNFQDKLATKPTIYDKVKIVPLGVPAALDIRPEGGADFVLTFRNVHNWVDDDNVDAFMKSFYDALKPGGVLGVVEHRAKPGSKLKQAIETGYMTEDFVIKHALMAGFKLDAKSEVNANPKDTKDYKKGVWTLPPVLTEGEVDRAKYLGIGESDRMTLRFVKPGK
ncbi:MAG: class I SAM-dependent methyltransferase [Betaproteobacteria bacterium]|nr:class I SAM-dependent methyltransferase [Betaproteobacteria bacterium]